MKSLLELWQLVAQDLGDLCRVSTARDVKTVTSRVENEGDSFLTITLPKFGKDLERSLDLGRVAPDAWTGFRSCGGLPRFLGGFLEQVFDTSTGLVLDAPSSHSIYAVRQLAGLCAKVELECSQGRVSAAYRKYIEVEERVKAHDSELGDDLITDFQLMGRKLLACVFTQVDGEVAYQRLLPSHGPGATADRLGGNAKYDLAEWTERMDRVFPSSDYLVPNFRFHAFLDRVDMLEPGHERPVKVTHVPKTLEKPRIIAEEPACMMYMQQALWREFKLALESDPLVGPMIGFTDQHPNQMMAKIGSTDGSLATIDLSDASDRVSNKLVLALMSNHPHLSEGVQACRSTSARVPGHGVIPLAKFASMGSALCFPVEAMVFLTIVLLGIQRAHGAPLHRKEIESLHGKVRVYGDDIIVPRDCARDVCDLLEEYGLKVNYQKSFWTGKFRESCGGDFYAGKNITPVRVRAPLPITHDEPVGLVSWVAFRNFAYERGLERTTTRLDNVLERALKGHFPVVGPDSPVLGRISSEGPKPQRLNPNTHTPEVKGWIAKPILRRNTLDGQGALMKYFLNLSDLPVADKEHLTYSGRPVAVTLKLRWESAT